jgi:hypothetical protein
LAVSALVLSFRAHSPILTYCLMVLIHFVRALEAISVIAVERALLAE